jgi:hypothetical protein
MKIELSDEALEYGRHARRAFEGAGGDDLVQRVEEQPELRAKEVEAVLSGLGAWDLDVRRSPDELEAAAALCRAAGWFALPYPLAERLARPADLDVDGLLVVDAEHPAAPVADLDLRWAAVTIDGRRTTATARPPTGPPRTPAFVTDHDLPDLAPPHHDHPDPDLPDLDIDVATGAAGALDAPIGLTLGCWTLLGMLDRSIELTSDYIRSRQQFGQPLASFQGVQFQLTDAEVERSGVDILAKYALWSIGSGKPEALNDALALRMSAIEAAEVVFRVCHQLHGAVGFCDETTLSWLSRYSQPLRRLPLGLSATRDELTRRVGRSGLTGLFA